MPVRFKVRIGDDGEVELDIYAFRLSRRSWFVKEHWDADRRHVPEFRLIGTSGDGLILTAIGYRGGYVGHMGRYHFEKFPPAGAAEPTDGAAENGSVGP